MLRTFIAIKVEASQALRRVLRTLGEMGRPVRPLDPNALHLTLRFLGQIDEAQVPGIVGAVEAAVETEAPFTMCIRGMGAFADSRRPSIIWADLEQPEPLYRIVGCLNDRLEVLGIGKDNRPWRAHLTLARVKSAPPAELRNLLKSHGATPFATKVVDAVELIGSDLRPSGPQYTVLASVVLSLDGKRIPALRRPFQLCHTRRDSRFGSDTM